MNIDLLREELTVDEGARRKFIYAPKVTYFRDWPSYCKG